MDPRLLQGWPQGSPEHAEQDVSPHREPLPQPAEDAMEVMFDVAEGIDVQRDILVVRFRTKAVGNETRCKNRSIFREHLGHPSTLKPHARFNASPAARSRQGGE